MPDKRLDLIKGMIDRIPDGYYAAQEDVGGHVDFVRISRPDRGKYDKSIKIQTQHAEAWRVDLVLWQSGVWSVYYPETIKALLLVISDHKTCSQKYGIEVQACCVCNKALTDDKSRHYLIGPVCDKKEAWQHVITEVDEINGGFSFEELVARGMPTRVWQERLY